MVGQKLIYCKAGLTNHLCQRNNYLKQGKSTGQKDQHLSLNQSNPQSQPLQVLVSDLCYVIPTKGLLGLY